MRTTISDPVTIHRVGADEASFVEVFSLLLEEHKEVACASLDAEKASRHCYTILQEGMTFVARNGQGEAVGTLSLTEHEHWYSKESALFDGWFYVKPAYRNNTVGADLMKAARAVAEAKNLLVFIWTTNPHRRPKKTSMTLMAQLAGFMPSGYLLKLR